MVRACPAGTVQPVMGAALLAEHEDVLGRDALFAGTRLSSTVRAELLDIFFAHCAWTRVYFTWRPNLPDEADNHLTEPAVAGAAPFIVTRNLRHLTRAELRFPGVQCLAPATFLKDVGAGQAERGLALLDQAAGDKPGRHGQS